MTFDYNKGADPTLAITVSDSTPAITYTVSFNANGGTGGTLPSAITQASVGASVTILVPSAATCGTKTGYTLDTTKWATTSGGTTYVNSGSYTPTANITLYAIWTSNKPTPPTITTSLPGGTVGMAYSQKLVATGSTSITWSIDSGSLPNGLTLNASTGVISGTPTTEETASFIVKASNGTNSDATKAFSIIIAAAPTTHTITASAETGGSISPSGTVMVNNGASKTFTISANSNYSISSVSVDGVSQGAISTYTFSNVTGNHTISATFSYNGGGGSSGGGSGSSSGDSSSTTTTPTTPTKPTEPVKGESNTTATVDKNGNATTTVTNKNISDAVKAAQDVANKKGVNAGEVTVVINVTAPANSNPNTVTVNLPKTVQQQVINNKIDHVVIVMNKPNISIDMNLATITEMNKQANADIQLSATRTNAAKLSTEAKNAIGNRPAFDLKATYNSGSKSITNFGTGKVIVAIPYTLKKGELAGGMYAVYVNGNGKATYITNSSYDAKNKVLRFSMNHFSVYGIGYKAPTGFTDIAKHWAKTDIEFVVNRKLMNGTSETTFSPTSAMTRGMFVTALGILAGVNKKDYQAQTFTDVKADAYYAPYVAWAVEKGITKGTTATTFSPNNIVTRQEMVVFMSNYAQAMGAKVPKICAANAFADNDSIASWAVEAVKQMQMAGVLNGKDGNCLDPNGAATRGAAAAVLRRYISLLIDPRHNAGA